MPTKMQLLVDKAFFTGHYILSTKSTPLSPLQVRNTRVVSAPALQHSLNSWATTIGMPITPRKAFLSPLARAYDRWMPAMLCGCTCAPGRMAVSRKIRQHPLHRTQAARCARPGAFVRVNPFAQRSRGATPIISPACPARGGFLVGAGAGSPRSL